MKNKYQSTFFLFFQARQKEERARGEKNQGNITKITKYYNSQLKEYENNYLSYLKKSKTNMYIQIYTTSQTNRLTSVPKNTVSMFDCCALALSRGELQDLALRPPLEKIQLVYYILFKVDFPLHEFTLHCDVHSVYEAYTYT